MRKWLLLPYAPTPLNDGATIVEVRTPTSKSLLLTKGFPVPSAGILRTSDINVLLEKVTVTASSTSTSEGKQQLLKAIDSSLPGSHKNWASSLLRYLNKFNILSFTPERTKLASHKINTETLLLFIIHHLVFLPLNGKLYQNKLTIGMRRELFDRPPVPGPVHSPW